MNADPRKPKQEHHEDISLYDAGRVGSAVRDIYIYIVHSPHPREVFLVRHCAE